MKKNTAVLSILFFIIFGNYTIISPKIIFDKAFFEKIPFGEVLLKKKNIIIGSGVACGVVATAFYLKCHFEFRNLKDETARFDATINELQNEIAALKKESGELEKKESGELEKMIAASQAKSAANNHGLSNAGQGGDKKSLEAEVESIKQKLATDCKSCEDQGKKNEELQDALKKLWDSLSGAREVYKKENSALKGEWDDDLLGRQYVLAAKEKEYQELNKKYNEQVKASEDLKSQHAVFENQCKVKEAELNELQRKESELRKSLEEKNWFLSYNNQQVTIYQNNYSQNLTRLQGKVLEMVALQHKIGAALFYANCFDGSGKQLLFNTFFTEQSNWNWNQNDIKALSGVIASFTSFLNNYTADIERGWKKRAQVAKHAISLGGIRKEGGGEIRVSCDVGGVTWDIWKLFSYLSTMYDTNVYYFTMDEAHKIGFFAQILFGHALVNDPYYDGEMAWERALFSQNMFNVTTVTSQDNWAHVAPEFLELTLERSYLLLTEMLKNSSDTAHQLVQQIEKFRNICVRDRIAFDGNSIYQISKDGKIGSSSDFNSFSGDDNQCRIDVDEKMKKYTPMVHFTTNVENIFVTSDAHSTYVPLSVDKIIVGNSLQISCGDVHDRVPQVSKDENQEWKRIFQFSNFMMWWQQKCLSGMQFLLDNRVVFVPGNHEMMAANLGILLLTDASSSYPVGIRQLYVGKDGCLNRETLKNEGFYTPDLLLFLQEYFYPKKDMSGVYSENNLAKIFSLERYAFFISMLSPKQFIIERGGEVIVGHHGALSPIMSQESSTKSSFKLGARLELKKITELVNSIINNIGAQSFPSLPKVFDERDIENIFFKTISGDNSINDFTFNHFVAHLPELWCDFQLLENNKYSNKGSFFVRTDSSKRITFHQELLKMLTAVSLGLFLNDKNLLRRKITLLVGHSQNPNNEHLVGFTNYMNKEIGIPFSLGSFESFDSALFTLPFSEGFIAKLILEEYLYGKTLEKLLISKNNEEHRETPPMNGLSMHIFMVSAGVFSEYMVTQTTMTYQQQYKKIVDEVLIPIGLLLNDSTIDSFKKRVSEVYNNFITAIQSRDRIAFCKKIPFILSVEHGNFNVCRSLSLAEFHPPFFVAQKDLVATNKPLSILASVDAGKLEYAIKAFNNKFPVAPLHNVISNNVGLQNNVQQNVAVSYQNNIPPYGGLSNVPMEQVKQLGISQPAFSYQNQNQNLPGITAAIPQQNQFQSVYSNQQQYGFSYNPPNNGFPPYPSNVNAVSMQNLNNNYGNGNVYQNQPTVVQQQFQQSPQFQKNPLEMSQMQPFSQQNQILHQGQNGFGSTAALIRQDQLQKKDEDEDEDIGATQKQVKKKNNNNDFNVPSVGFYQDDGATQRQVSKKGTSNVPVVDLNETYYNFSSSNDQSNPVTNTNIMSMQNQHLAQNQNQNFPNNMNGVPLSNAAVSGQSNIYSNVNISSAQNNGIPPLPKNLLPQNPLQQDLFDAYPILSRWDTSIEDLKNAVNGKQLIQGGQLNQELLFLPYAMQTQLSDVENQIVDDAEKRDFKDACQFFYGAYNQNQIINWNLFQYIYGSMPQSNEYYQPNEVACMTFIRNILFHLCFGNNDVTKYNNITTCKSELNGLSYNALLNKQNMISTFLKPFRTIVTLQGSYFFYLLLQKGFNLFSQSPKFDDTAAPWEREIYDGLRKRVIEIISAAEEVDKGALHTISGGSDPGVDSSGIFVKKDGSLQSSNWFLKDENSSLDKRIKSAKRTMMELTAFCPVHVTKITKGEKKNTQIMSMTDLHSTYGFPMFFNTITSFIGNNQLNKEGSLVIYMLGDFINKIHTERQQNSGFNFISNFCNFLLYLYGMHAQSYLNYVFKQNNIAVQLASVQGNHEANSFFLPLLFDLQRSGNIDTGIHNVPFYYSIELANFMQRIGIFDIYSPTALANAARVDNLLTGTSYLAPSGIFRFDHGEISTGQHSICPQPLILPHDALTNDRNGSFLVGLRVGNFYRVLSDNYFMSTFFESGRPLCRYKDHYFHNNEYNELCTIESRITKERLKNIPFIDDGHLFILTMLSAMTRNEKLYSTLFKFFIDENIISLDVFNELATTETHGILSRNFPNDTPTINNLSVASLSRALNSMMNAEINPGINLIYTFYGVMLSKWCDPLFGKKLCADEDQAVRISINELLYPFIYIFNYGRMNGLFTDTRIEKIDNYFGHSHTPSEEIRFSDNKFDKTGPTKCSFISMRKSAGKRITTQLGLSLQVKEGLQWTDQQRRVLKYNYLSTLFDNMYKHFSYGMCDHMLPFFELVSKILRNDTRYLQGNDDQRKFNKMSIVSLMSNKKNPMIMAIKEGNIGKEVYNEFIKKIWGQEEEPVNPILQDEISLQNSFFKKLLLHYCYRGDFSGTSTTVQQFKLEFCQHCNYKEDDQRRRLYTILKKSSTIDYGNAWLCYSTCAPYCGLINAGRPEGCSRPFAIFGRRVLSLGDFDENKINETMQIVYTLPKTIRNFFTSNRINEVLMTLPGYQKEMSWFNSYNFHTVNKKFDNYVQIIMDRYMQGNVERLPEQDTFCSPFMRNYIKLTQEPLFQENFFESFMRDIMRLTGLMELFRTERCMQSMVGGYTYQGVKERLSDPLFSLIQEHVRYISTTYFGCTKPVSKKGVSLPQKVRIKPKAFLFLEALALMAYDINFTSQKNAPDVYNEVYKNHNCIDVPLGGGVESESWVDYFNKKVSFFVTYINGMDDFAVYGDPHSSMQSGFLKDNNIIVGDIGDKQFFQKTFEFVFDYYSTASSEKGFVEKINKFQVRFQLMHIISSIMYNILFHSGFPHKLYLRGNHESTFIYQTQECDSLRGNRATILSYIFDYMRTPMIINRGDSGLIEYLSKDGIDRLPELFVYPKNVFHNNNYDASDEVVFLSNKIADIMRKVFHYGFPIAAVGVGTKENINIFHHTMLLPRIMEESVTTVRENIEKNKMAKKMVATIPLRVKVDKSFFENVKDCNDNVCSLTVNSFDAMVLNPYAFFRCLNGKIEFKFSKKDFINECALSFLSCFFNEWKKKKPTVWFGHEQNGHLMHLFLTSGLNNKSIVIDIEDINSEKFVTHNPVLWNNSFQDPSYINSLNDTVNIDDTVRFVLTAHGPDSYYNFFVNAREFWDREYQSFGNYNFFPPLGIMNLNLITVVKGATVSTGYSSVCSAEEILINDGNFEQRMKEERKVTVSFLNDVAKNIEDDLHKILSEKLQAERIKINNLIFNDHSAISRHVNISRFIQKMMTLNKISRNIINNNNNNMQMQNKLTEEFKSFIDLYNKIPNSIESFFKTFVEFCSYSKRYFKEKVPKSKPMLGVGIPSSYYENLNNLYSIKEKDDLLSNRL